LGPEARARAVRGRGVERNAVDRDVDAPEVGDVRRAHECPDPGEAWDHLGIERPVRRLRHRFTVTRWTCSFEMCVSESGSSTSRSRAAASPGSGLIWTLTARKP